MKCFTVFVILVVGPLLASAQTIPDKPTPTISPISELANLSYQLGIAYQQAQQGQDVTIYNILVDQYNAWVQQHFSEGADALLRSKIIATDLKGVEQKQKVSDGKYVMKNPFKPGSDLSKFGKQLIRGDFYIGHPARENPEEVVSDINWEDR